MECAEGLGEDIGSAGVYIPFSLIWVTLNTDPSGPSFQVTTAHDMFESTAYRQPKSHCLGSRSYDPVTKTFGQYQWIDYQTVQKRRAALGAGLVELHNKHGCGRPGPYGIGLWCQNRPEWQITGT